jgi:hypothetical protein
MLAVLLLAGTAWAVTRHVPADYATIQSALNAVQNGDTVLVALGTYAEALQCPGRSFVLKGDAIPDTGDYPRPVIDPTSLTNPRGRTCLTLPTLTTPLSITVEDLSFHNGAAMYPHDPGSNGGISGGCPGVMLRRCILDSTAGGYVAGWRSISMERCEFRTIQGACVYSTESHFALHATDCVFHGRALFNIHVGDSSTFLRCRFLGNRDGSLCMVTGRGIRIEDCIFGPSEANEQSFDPALWLGVTSGLVQNNVFEGLYLGHEVITLDCACDDTSVVTLRNNRVVNNIVNAQGTFGVYLVNDNGGNGRCRAVIEDNVFENNFAPASGGFVGLYLREDCAVRGNRFRHLDRERNATVTLAPVIAGESLDDYALHGNRFDSTGYAVQIDRSTDTLDARWNWWGDSTGPYHAAANPQGLGDTITGFVKFAPWCEDTVMCEEPSAITLRAAAPPSAFRLSAYPNPFNSTTVLQLEVPQAEIVRVELFDLLGRRVKELWAGLVADQKEITVDGRALASGVYFVRATDTIWNRPLVSAKIVLLK